MFDGAHDMAFYHPTFVVNNTNHMPGKQGLDKLLAYSMRGAFHDSSDRWPPPSCHYNSRQELRKTITDWAIGHEAGQKPLLWIHGPFGVGKSAVAQNSAEALAALMKLAASLFFSRPNRRNDPNRIFTSIAYQLVLQCPPLGDVLDRVIMHNPTILTAALPHQFQELIVIPLLQVTQAAKLDGWTIILDGFDEIDGIEAQYDIINIIVTSIRDRTTPFRWFILSRPEAHIQRAMAATDVAPLLHTLDLPLSPENDHEILTFLMKELQEIGEKHKLPQSWCTEVEFAILVKLAGGLWIYVSTITRFIGDAKSFGPQSQLHLVLSLAQKQTRPLATNPLAAMDLFYNLIVEQIPSHVLPTALKILLLQHMIMNKFDGNKRGLRIFVVANILRLRIEVFSAACSFLPSVLFIVNDQGHPSHIQFYHASFMEYAQNPQRSGKFCIWGDCLEDLRLEVIERVSSVHSCSSGGLLKVNFTWRPSVLDDEPKSWSSSALFYYAMISVMFGLCQRRARAITPSTAAALQNVAFSYIPRFARGSGYPNMVVEYDSLRDNLPPDFCDKIVRKSTNPLHLRDKPAHLDKVHTFILGTAPNGLLCWSRDNDFTEDTINISFDDREYLLYETETSMTPDEKKNVKSKRAWIRRRQCRWLPKWLRAIIFRSQKGHR
ncbi:hypothetical protein NP233_g9756 [Leucocoprinus birnbaumii]|uniref:Nephrocystin 3-like N-terminal domain-containing protein n=1 Tax=Leucocoprinus birnbaumii TaxID=56174 RepID=A0AAD5VJT8_9AGAR|nr:hypothetical protein NP233_g9756 [Leucocoprinus birnbaumii]